MNIWKKINGHVWTDNTYNQMVSYLKTNTLPKFSTKDAKYNFLNRAKYYTIKNDNLVFKTKIPSWDSHSLESQSSFTFKVLKPSNIDALLQSYFTIESKMALNYKTLYDKVRRDGFIGISRKDIETYLKNNPVHLKENRIQNDPLYLNSYRPLYPFEHWQIDLIDFRRIAKYNKFAENPDRYYNFILVIIDIFSKFVYLYPIEGIYDSTEKTSLKMTHEICNNIQKLFLSGDIPKKIGCDNGFNVKPFIELCNVFSIKPVFSLPHNPQTNGFVENKNKQIKGFIYYHFNRHYKETGFKYYDILDHIAYSINNTKHSVTNKTPNEIHKGRILPLPANYIEVKNLPVSFDKAFPVFDNSYKIEKEIKKKSKMIQIDESHCENSIIDSYNKAAQTIYNDRVQYVREKIHNAAQKREDLYKLKKSTKRFTPQSLVKIRTYIDVHDNKIQPVQLKIQNAEKSIELKNPLFRLTSGKFITDIKHQPKPSRVILKSQYNWLNLPDGLPPVFKIKEIVLFPNNTKKYFRLTTFDNQYDVSRIVSLVGKKAVYSYDFSQQFLHHADYTDVQKTAQYRPEYTHKSFDNLHMVYNINKNENNILNNDFELRKPNTQYDYLANQKVKQLLTQEYTKLWNIIETNNEFDKLTSNEIVLWYNTKQKTTCDDGNCIQVVGVLKKFIQSGRNKNHYYVTLYDGNRIVKNQAMVKLHTDANDVLEYVVHGQQLEKFHNEFVFRYPYFIRSLFNL